MAGMDGKSMLETAVNELIREKERFKKLIYSGEAGLFGDKSTAIQDMFSESWTTIDNLLTEITTAKEAGNYPEAWRGCVRLKRHLLPRLSSDLLSVLGGLYVRSKDLDNICEIEEGIKEKLSFAAQAEALIRDLSRQSKTVWNSVLIVGEERYDLSEADIIRLRYPACDLWNLPFTAHEYGYLVAVRKPPKGFEPLRNDVQKQVKPDEREKMLQEKALELDKQKKDYPNAEIPARLLPDDKCYLPQVSRLWERYRNNPTDEERKIFLENNQIEMADLQLRQVAHLNRLFADAFATFFIGPAYIYTLLQFHFTPDESLYGPTLEMPAFAQRFVFALETLKWMNTDTRLKRENVKSLPFNREIYQDERNNPQGIFISMWEMALQTSGDLPNRYREIADNFKAWLQQIHQAFREDIQYNSIIGIANTYQRWVAAEHLKIELVKPTLKVIQASKDEIVDNKLCSVLNAAWSARWGAPDLLTTIEGNSLKLLLGQIEIQISEGTPAPAGNKKTVQDQGSSGNPQKVYLEKISKALFDLREYPLQKRFDAKIKQGKENEIPGDMGYDIYLALSEKNTAAWEAYQLLFSKS